MFSLNNFVYLRNIDVSLCVLCRVRPLMKYKTGCLVESFPGFNIENKYQYRKF